MPGFSRQEQKKFFICCCLADDPFVIFVKQAGIPFRCWPYVNAVRRWRNKIKEIVQKKMIKPEKDEKKVQEKTLCFFTRLTAEKIPLTTYLNFLILSAETIREHVNAKEKHLWEKLIENLFHLYCYFDPELNDNESMDEAEKWHKLLEEVF